MSKKEIKEEQEQTTVGTTFQLTDNHVDVLRKNASALNSYYAGIGAQFCEMMENIKQVDIIRKNISQLQEDIAKELDMPRAERINWNLDKKTAEIVK